MHSSSQIHVRTLPELLLHFLILSASHCVYCFILPVDFLFCSLTLRNSWLNFWGSLLFYNVLRDFSNSLMAVPILMDWHEPPFPCIYFNNCCLQTSVLWVIDIPSWAPCPPCLLNITSSRYPLIRCCASVLCRYRVFCCVAKVTILCCYLCLVFALLSLHSHGE